MPEFQGYTFGNSFFQGFLEGRRLKQDQEQFNARQASEERQQSMLQAWRETQAILEDKKWQAQEADKFVEVAPNDPYNQIGVPTGKQPKTLIDDWMRKYTADQGRELKEAIANQLDLTKREAIANRMEVAGLRNEIASANLENKKQAIEEKRIEKISKMEEEAGNVLAILQTGADGKGNIKYNNKNIPQKMMNKIYSNKIDALVKTVGISPTINSLLSKAQKDNPDFKGKSKTEQRNILKSILDSRQDIPEEIKGILYKYAETYRD